LLRKSSVKKRILLVEDNMDMRELVSNGLTALGYEVMVARNGREAVELATAQLPDLLVMDIMLPDMNGLEVTSQIRKNPKTKGIPVLAATARVLPADREKCLESGCDGYIAKPFRLKELRAAIDKLLTDRN
jgi:CheY-like chemotaxis protein